MLSHSAENFRKGILLFLRKFLVSKSFMDEKEVSRFSVENFWSYSAEKFRGHPFNVSEKWGYRKILCIIGGVTIFRFINFGHQKMLRINGKIIWHNRDSNFQPTA